MSSIEHSYHFTFLPGISSWNVDVTAESLPCKKLASLSLIVPVEEVHDRPGAASVESSANSLLSGEHGEWSVHGCFLSWCPTEGEVISRFGERVLGRRERSRELIRIAASKRPATVAMNSALQPVSSQNNC